MHPIGQPSLVDDERTARTARALRLEHELTTALAALRGAGVPTVVLKGIPLARRLFDGLSRHQIDNDVLVPLSQVPRAVEALAALGYRPYSSVPLEVEIRRGEFRQALLRASRDGAPVCLEVHWNAFPPLLYPVPERVLWDRTVPFAVRDETTAVFDDALTLLELASHFAQHRFTEARILRDVAAAWNRWHGHLDMQDVLSLAAPYGLEHPLDFALRAAHDLGLLDAAPPAIGSRRAERLRAVLPATRLFEARPSPDPVRAALAATLVAPRRLPRWVGASVFPPPAVVAHALGTSSRVRIAGHYAARPFLPAGRALRRRLTSPRAGDQARRRGSVTR